MKKAVAALILVVALFPAVSHAATDDELRSQIALLQAQVAVLMERLAYLETHSTETIMTDTPAPTFGAAQPAFAFEVTPTATKERVELRTSTRIDQVHFCYRINGGGEECATLGVPLEKGDDYAVFGWDNPTPGSYAYTMTGIQYGPSGKYGGANAQGDWKKAQVTGSFEVE